jgi:hypothetical protein
MTSQETTPRAVTGRRGQKSVNLDAVPVENRSGVLYFARQFPSESPLNIVAIFLIAVFLFLTILGPTLAPYDPIVPDTANRFHPPSGEHWFGTDNLGRDVLSRVMAGARISLGIATLIISIAVVVGNRFQMLGSTGEEADAEGEHRCTDQCQTDRSAASARQLGGRGLRAQTDEAERAGRQNRIADVQRYLDDDHRHRVRQNVPHRNGEATGPDRLQGFDVLQLLDGIVVAETVRTDAHALRRRFQGHVRSWGERL